MSTRYLSVRACNSIFSEYPDVVGIKEICKMLGIGKDKAYELVKNGELRKIPCSRSVKVPKISVIEYILRCMQLNLLYLKIYWQNQLEKKHLLRYNIYVSDRLLP